MTPVTNRSAALTAASACLLFLATAAGAASSEDRLDTAVRNANADWAEAMKTGDAKAIVAPYTDAAVFVLPDGRSLQGRAEIEALYRTGFARSGLANSTSIDSKSLVRDGDLAYESGSAEVGSVKQGQSVTRSSRYLTVWQQQADGDWKILRNVVLP